MADSFATTWTVVCQAPPSMGFPRQEYWNGLPVPSPGDHPNLGTEAASPALASRCFTTEPYGKPQLTGALVAGCAPKSVPLLPASRLKVGEQSPDQGTLPTLVASCHRVTSSPQWKVTEVIRNMRQYQTQHLEPRFSSPGSPFPVCSLDSAGQAKHKPSPKLSTRRTTC